jgi:hypothetical protein
MIAFFNMEGISLFHRQSDFQHLPPSFPMFDLCILESNPKSSSQENNGYLPY